MMPTGKCIGTMSHSAAQKLSRTLSPDTPGILSYGKNSYLVNVTVTKYLIEMTTRKEGFMVAGSQFQRDLSSLWWKRQGRARIASVGTQDDVLVT